MKNDTDGQIKTTSFYAACGPLDRIIDAGQTVVLDNGGCCPYQVDAHAISGSVAGQSTTHTPHSTGAGISCQNNEVTFVSVGGQLNSVRGIGAQTAPAIANINIVNATNQQLAVTLNYLTPDSCASETKIVGPNSQLGVQIGLCCLKNLVVQGAGKMIMVNAGRCARMQYTIKIDAAGNLVAEAVNW
jgi:hypothetical protein